MSNSMKVMLAGAALAGLLTGTSAKLQAQTTNQNQNAGIRAVSMQDDGGTNKTDKDKLKSMLVRGKTPAKARAVVIQRQRVQRQKRLQRQGWLRDRRIEKKMYRTINPSSSRTNALQPQWVGVECPGPLFSWKN